jgi:hypothetical protein
MQSSLFGDIARAASVSSGSLMTGTLTASKVIKSTQILGPFVMQLKTADYMPNHSKIIKKESVRAMLDNVSQVFMLVDRPDSRLNGDGKFAFLLQQQLWGYRASNIPEKHQVASSGSAL